MFRVFPVEALHTRGPDHPNAVRPGWEWGMHPCVLTWRARSRGDGGRAWSGGRYAWSAYRTVDTGSAFRPCGCECGGRARLSEQISSHSRAKCMGKASHLQHGDEKRKSYIEKPSWYSVNIIVFWTTPCTPKELVLNIDYSVTYLLMYFSFNKTTFFYKKAEITHTSNNTQTYKLLLT